MRVMIVDDDKNIIHVVKKILENEGYEVYSALGGKECIESIGGIAPSILILDVMMPYMDGWEVLRELKNMGVLDEVKVIMLTVVKEPGEEATELSAYVDDYITKPFNREDFVETLSCFSSL